MTFSLVARCADTAMFGVAIASSSPAVATRCAYASAGIGAVASQNITDPRLGPQALHLMANGATATETAAIIARAAPHAAFRQLLAVDTMGNSAVHSGSKALGVFGGATGPNVAAGGNMLASAAIPQAMVACFAATGGHLGDRLIAGLQAALALGGEAGPVHSAGLLIVHDQNWPLADLRCDWADDDPITVLSSLWLRYRPQMQAYVTRALNPTEAPSYGVPGDR